MYVQNVKESSSTLSLGKGRVTSAGFTGIATHPLSSVRTFVLYQKSPIAQLLERRAHSTEDKEAHSNDCHEATGELHKFNHKRLYVAHLLFLFISFVHRR